VTPEPTEQLEELCAVLNQHGVQYVVFGSFAGRLQGAELQTLDIDIVPGASRDNLQRLTDALNTLEPRWRVAEEGEGMRIDGGLEPRHFEGDTLAIGLITRVGYVDVVLRPRGFEAGFSALAEHAVHVSIAGNDVLVGALEDLVTSKELLAREKDVLHLAELRRRLVELGREPPDTPEHQPGHERGRDRGHGYDIGL